MNKRFIYNPDKHFLGEPCKNGHQGYRFKSSPGVCCECRYNRKAYNKKYNKLRGTKPSSMATRLLISTRNRQKNKDPNAPFTLTKEWIQAKIESGKCEVTGLPFNLNITTTLKRPFAPSIDKIDPSGSYTKENCQVVCFIYNVAKGQFSHEDVITLSNAVCNKRC